MERLTSHSYEAILVLVLLACFVLIAETAALFWSAVRLDRHRIRRSLPEIAALAVTLYITILRHMTGWHRSAPSQVLPPSAQVSSPCGERLGAEDCSLRRGSSPCRSSTSSCPSQPSSFSDCSQGVFCSSSGTSMRAAHTK